MTRTNINKLVYPVPALIAMDGNGNEVGSNFRPMDDVEYVNDKGGYVDQITTDFIKWIRLNFYAELSNVTNPSSAYYSKARNDGLSSGDFDFGKYGVQQAPDNTATTANYFEPIDSFGVNAQNKIVYTAINGSPAAKAVYSFPSSFYKSVVGVANGRQFDGKSDPKFVSNTGLYALTQNELVLLNDFTPGDTTITVLGSTFYLDTSWDTAPTADTTFKKVFLVTAANGGLGTFGWISATVIDPKRNIFQLAGLFFISGTNAATKAGSRVQLATGIVGIPISTMTCQLACNFDITTLQDNSKTLIRNATHTVLKTSDGGVYPPNGITDASLGTSSFDADGNIGVVNASSKTVVGVESVTKYLLDKYGTLLSYVTTAPTEYGVTSFTQDMFKGTDFARDVLSTKTLDIDQLAIISLVRGYSEVNALYYLKSSSPLPNKLQTFIFGTSPVGGTSSVVVLGDGGQGRLFWFSASLMCQGDLNKDKLILSWIPRDRDGNKILITSINGSVAWSGGTNYTHNRGMITSTGLTPNFSGPIIFSSGTAYCLVDSHTVQLVSSHSAAVGTSNRGDTSTRANAVKQFTGYFGLGWFSTETNGLYCASNGSTLTRSPYTDGTYSLFDRGVFLPAMRGWGSGGGSISGSFTQFRTGYGYQKQSLPANVSLPSKPGQIIQISQGRTGGTYQGQISLTGVTNIFNAAVRYYIEVNWSVDGSSNADYVKTQTTSATKISWQPASGTITIGGNSRTVSSGSGFVQDTGNTPVGVAGGVGQGTYGFFLTVGAGTNSIDVQVSVNDPGNCPDPPIHPTLAMNSSTGSDITVTIYVSTVGFASNQVVDSPDASYITAGAAGGDQAAADLDTARVQAANQTTSVVPVLCYQNHPGQVLRSNIMNIDSYYSVTYNSGLPQNLLLPKKYDSLLFWFGPNVGGNEAIFGGDFSVAEVMERGGYTIQNKDAGNSIQGALQYPYFYPISKNSTASFYHIGGNITTARNVNNEMGVTISLNGDLTYTSTDIVGYDHIIAYDDYNEAAGVIPVMVGSLVTPMFPPNWPSIFSISDALFFKGLTRDSILDKTGMKPLVLSSTFAFASYNPSATLQFAKITLPDATTQTVAVDNLSATRVGSNGLFKVTLPGVHIIDADNSNLGRNVYSITAVQLTISSSSLDTINGGTVTITNSQGVKWTPTLCESISDDYNTTTAFPTPANGSNLHYVPTFVEIADGDSFFTTSDKITWTLTLPKNYDARPRAGRKFPFIVVGQLDGNFVFAFTDPITLF